MSPNWTQVLRFAPGSALRFSLALNAGLRVALERSDQRVARWLEMLDDATLHLTDLEPTVCRVQGRAGPATLELVANGTHISLRLDDAQQQHARDYTDLALMLAGSREALIARRDEHQTTPYLRLRYTHQNPNAEVALYTAGFTSRVPSALRALLPTVAVVGHLQPVDVEA